MDDLKDLRTKIDQLDQRISQLLGERLVLSKEVQEIKQKKNLPIYDPAREKEILQKFENGYEKEIFRKILEESRKK